MCAYHSPLSSRYTYDALGNRVTKTTPAGTEALLYNSANQVTEIQQGMPAGPVLATYQYDDNGRRLSETMSYLYDGLNILAEYCQDWQRASAPSRALAAPGVSRM